MQDGLKWLDSVVVMCVVGDGGGRGTSQGFLRVTVKGSVSLVNDSFDAIGDNGANEWRQCNGCSIGANGDSVSGANGNHNRHCGTNVAIVAIGTMTNGSPSSLFAPLSPLHHCRHCDK